MNGLGFKGFEKLGFDEMKAFATVRADGEEGSWSGVKCIWREFSKRKKADKIWKKNNRLSRLSCSHSKSLPNYHYDLYNQ